MAKKVRRVKKRRRKQTSSQVEETAVVETAAEPPISTTDQFRLEYAYVVKDLRRVLILAAAMFILLITLNLLLQ